MQWFMVHKNFYLKLKREYLWILAATFVGSESQSLPLSCLKFCVEFIFFLCFSKVPMASER